ncbi:hypothetical protein [Nonomuraea sp. NPDC001699]
MPTSWDDQAGDAATGPEVAARRDRCGIPGQERHRPKWMTAVEMLDALIEQGCRSKATPSRTLQTWSQCPGSGPAEAGLPPGPACVTPTPPSAWPNTSGPPVATPRSRSPGAKAPRAP